MQNTGRVAIYARVSTKDKQDYKRQVDELLAIAQTQGYNKPQVDIYAEKISGTKNSNDRPELERLIQNTESDPKYYDYILTSEISRIGRNPSDTRRTIDRWSDLNIPLYLQSIGKWTIENGKRDATMNIVLQVLMEFAQVEIDQMKTRSKSGKLNAAKQGKFTGGDIAFGYSKVDGYYVIVPSEAEIVKEIFKLYKSGEGVKNISNILNSKGIKNRTETSWHYNGIYYILTNPIYKGERKYLDEIIKAPVIISTELFDECQDIREGKTTRNIVTDNIYLLKNKCTCGVCGRNYFAKYAKNTGLKAYICSSRFITKCGNVGVNIALVESTIYNELINADLVLKYLNNTDKMKTDVKANITKFENQKLVAERAITSLEKQIEKLLDLFLKDKLKEATYVSKNENLESELKSEKSKLVNIKREITTNKITLTNLEDTNTTKQMLSYAKGNRGELAAIFSQVIHNITFTPIDKKNTLATVIIAIGGVVLPYRLNILLHLRGVMGAVKKYQYRATFHKYKGVENDEFYADEILEDLQLAPLITIADENIIDITKEKPLTVS